MEGEVRRPRSPDVKVLGVGISLGAACGVRDYGRLLAEALTADGLLCSVRWLTRDERSLRRSRVEVRAWTRALDAELSERPPDAVLLHYSVFAYSHRGVPLFVAPVLRRLRASGAPIVTVLHEYVYPWRRADWRAWLWAATQRAQLIDVVRASSAAIVAGEARADWLASRPWLPTRRVLVAPVFSSLPPPSRVRPAPRALPVLGLFGYSYQGAALSLIVGAVADLHRRGVPAQLRLLGAPGAASAAGASWLAAARTNGLERAVSFTGALPAQALSDELAACDVLLFADAAGPTPRKSTLAGSLASGVPVVALDGPQTWPEPVRRQAIRLAPPSPQGLADTLADLLLDADARATLGDAGQAFARTRMSLERTVSAARALILEACQRAPSGHGDGCAYDAPRTGAASEAGAGS